ncbi:MAG: hypothetical protein ACRC62_01305 [Microcoleus sp.]
MTLIFTGFLDRKGIPIAVGDLVRIPHFKAARNRQVWMYKRVRVDLNAPANCQVILTDLDDTHRCRIHAADQIEVIDGESIDHPTEKWLVCWWERKRLKTWDGLNVLGAVK